MTQVNINYERQNKHSQIKFVSYKFSQTNFLLFLGVTPNQTLSDEYIKKGKEITEKQIVIGGSRLAAMLKTLNMEQW